MSSVRLPPSSTATSTKLSWQNRQGALGDLGLRRAGGEAPRGPSERANVWAPRGGGGDRTRDPGDRGPKARGKAPRLDLGREIAPRRANGPPIEAVNDVASKP